MSARRQVILGTFKVLKSPNYGVNHLALCMGHLFSPISGSTIGI